MECPICDEEGKVPCVPCNGSGEVDCNTCQGPGTLPPETDGEGEGSGTGECICSGQEIPCECACCQPECEESSVNTNFVFRRKHPKDSKVGDSVAQNGCFLWDALLGRTMPDGAEAGSLSIYLEELSVETFGPEAIWFTSFSKHVKTRGALTDGHWQARTPDALVDVVQLSPGSHQKVFEVRFYRNFQVQENSGGSDVWGPVMMAGVPIEGYSGSEFYTFKPGESGSPFVKFRMELLSGPHPNGVAARARVIETRGSKVVTHTFLQHTPSFEVLDGVHASVKHWQLNRSAEGQVVKYHKKEWETASLRQERRWTLNRNDVLMEDETWREENLFLDGTFVLTNHTEVTSLNGATPPLVTQYTYGQVMGEPSYKKQVSIRYPDGGWVRYRYSDPADPTRVASVPWVIYRPCDLR